jgi:hypothetical protein
MKIKPMLSRSSLSTEFDAATNYLVKTPTNTMVQAAGQAIGVAVGGTIFQNSMKREILKHPSIAARASEWSADSTALVEIIKAMPQVSTFTNMTVEISHLLFTLVCS